MKIEVGKKYMDGEGTIVGPIQRRYYPFYGETNDGNYRVYTADGCYLGKDNPRVEDLVAEYKETPVFVDPGAYFSSEDKIPDCMDYTEQNDDDSSMPLLNIFKPIRTAHSKVPAKFLARAKDGTYLFEVGGRYNNVQRVDADDVDNQFENVPDETRAVVRMYKNAEGNKFFVWGGDARSQSALATCELSYSDEYGWKVRDLEGDN